MAHEQLYKKLLLLQEIPHATYSPDLPVISLTVSNKVLPAQFEKNVHTPYRSVNYLATC